MKKLRKYLFNDYVLMLLLGICLGILFQGWLQEQQDYRESLKSETSLFDNLGGVND